MLKSAIIGLGRMGAEPSSRLEGKIGPGWLPLSHAEAIISTQGIDLSAICDRDEARVAHFSKIYGVNRVYIDYKTLLDEVRPDILSIATRTDIRCDIIHQAIAYGVKGIYAEKPISRSIDECLNVMNAICGSGVKLVYGATRRAMEIYRLAKEICWSGELGEVQHISTEFGRSPLLWSLPHAADLIVFFANTTKWQSAQGNCTFDANDFDVENQVMDADPKLNIGYYSFDNGISASIVPGTGTNIRISCSKGILTVNGDGHHIEINKEAKFPGYFHDLQRIEANPKESGTQRLFADLCHSVRTGEPVMSVKPEEIIAGQELLFASVQSALEQGIIVTPSELNKQLVITGRSGVLYA